MSMRNARSGFTLAEVVVAGFILAVLAAVTIPQVLDALAKKRIDDTYEILQEVQYAFTNTTQTGFLNVVRSGATVSTSSTVPGRLVQLVSPIVANQAATHPNSCGAAYTTTAQTTWASFGPFLDRVVTTTDGLATPIGRFQNTLNRTLAVQGTFTLPVFIRLTMPDVDSVDAVNLDRKMDGAVGATTGAIQYTFSAGEASVDFLIPIVNRC